MCRDLSTGKRLYEIRLEKEKKQQKEEKERKIEEKEIELEKQMKSKEEMKRIQIEKTENQTHQLKSKINELMKLNGIKRSSRFFSDDLNDSNKTSNSKHITISNDNIKESKEMNKQNMKEQSNEKKQNEKKHDKELIDKESKLIELNPF